MQTGVQQRTVKQQLICFARNCVYQQGEISCWGNTKTSQHPSAGKTAPPLRMSFDGKTGQ